jgi:hypothetical protein
METKKNKLFIGLPIYGAVDPAFFKSWTDFLIDNKVSYELMINSGDSLVSRSRNNITAEFLKSDSDILCMIDTDLVFTTEQVKRMLSNFDRNPEIKIIGGMYPKKDPHTFGLVLNSLNDPRKASYLDNDKIYEVKTIGTGFIFAKREVYESIGRKFRKEIEYKDDSSGEIKFDFYRVGVSHSNENNGRFMSEDWFFCDMARQCGIKIWCDQTVFCGHHGMILYPTPEQQRIHLQT